MKNTTANSVLHSNVGRASLVTAVVLLVPLLTRVPWTLSDFIIMGILIFGTTYAIGYATCRVEKRYRVLVGIGILAIFFLIWTQLAVGLLGKMFLGMQCVLERGMPEIVNCANEVRKP